MKFLLINIIILTVYLNGKKFKVFVSFLFFKSAKQNRALQTIYNLGDEIILPREIYV